jgi:hypothetical protein
LRVSNVRIYRNENNKTKIDFSWSGSRYPIRWISLTDQEYYARVNDGEVTIANAYIVVSIPKDMDVYVNPHTGQRQAFKFVSKVFEIPEHHEAPRGYSLPPRMRPVPRQPLDVDDELPF